MESNTLTLDKRIRLVVYKNHTLGYINPLIPTTVQILHTSPLKGSPTTSNLTSSFPINDPSDVRTATPQDFEEYRVSFKGYENPTEYEYTHPGWDCQCCGKDCFQSDKDYYMLQHDVWNRIAEKPKGMMCMDCVEEKLGRKLEKKDILVCYVTMVDNPYTQKILNGDN